MTSRNVIVGVLSYCICTSTVQYLYCNGPRVRRAPGHMDGISLDRYIHAGQHIDPEAKSGAPRGGPGLPCPVAVRLAPGPWPTQDDAPHGATDLLWVWSGGGRGRASLSNPPRVDHRLERQ